MLVVSQLGLHVWALSTAMDSWTSPKPILDPHRHQHPDRLHDHHPATVGMIFNDINISRDGEVASLTTCCEISLVFTLSMC